jgi:aminoglycoside phosphotransferase (APT) family kinase protein
MTDLVFDRFASSIDADKILTPLQNAQALWQRIDHNRCCISGDPNPTNWRVRDDGTLVLVDWERFGYGTPAIDLAILMPGLGSPDGKLETWIASNYVEFWRMANGEVPFLEATLTAQIQLAKLWTAVEFIAGAAKNPEAYPRNTVRFLVEHLPDMLQRTESIECALG